MNDGYTLYQGYEVPRSLSKGAKKVLLVLRHKGAVIYQFDGGPSALVARELITIAENIGLDIFVNQYRIVLIEAVTIIRGDNNEVKHEPT
jgi:hypothetical protein